MPSTILSDNGVSSGSAGLKSTAGNDGILALQTTTSGGTATNAIYINTSQNVLIGKTSDDNTTQGIKLANAGYASFTLPNDYPIIANRQSSDGDIIRLRRDGTDVGAVGGASGGIYFSSGATPTKAMTIDSSQNVGVGTTSPAARFEAVSSSGSNISIANFRTGDSTAANNVGGGFYGTSSATAASRIAYLWLDADGANFSGSDYFYLRKYGNSGDIDLVQVSSAAMTFYTSGTERARIDSNGYLLVGTTTGLYNARITAYSASTSGASLITATSSEYSLVAVNQATSGNNGFLLFQTENSPVTRGSITYNRGGGLVAYNTTSDYRAKTVTGPVQNALSKLASLKPSTGRMNGAEFDIDFFVAHELQEVVPSAVTGEKDAVKEDGAPEYQMVDKSALIPLLTAAIQELNAKVDAQAAEIAALKGTQP